MTYDDTDSNADGNIDAEVDNSLINTANGELKDDVDAKGNDINNVGGIQADDENIGADNKPATAGLTHPLEVVTTDDNRAIAIWHRSTDDVTDSDPGRRGGITALMPDGQEMWRLTGDAADEELSLYGNTDPSGNGPDSGAYTKAFNVASMGPRPWSGLFNYMGDIRMTSYANNNFDLKLQRDTENTSDSAALIQSFRDGSGNYLYGQRVDAGGSWNLDQAGFDTVARMEGDGKFRFVAGSNPHIEPMSSPPSTSQNGDIAYADGTNWDPGSGEGFYGHENGSWVKF